MSHQTFMLPFNCIKMLQKLLQTTYLTLPKKAWSSACMAWPVAGSMQVPENRSPWSPCLVCRFPHRCSH